MTINKNFAKYVSEEKIEYSPSSFKINGGIILNPPESIYLSKGYYKVIDEKPNPESGCYVKFSRYLKDDELKTITLEYVQIMIPVTKEVHTYSKLKLESVMFKMDKTKLYDEFLDNTLLSNDYGSTIPLRKLYDQAQELKDDNEYFETYLKKAESYLSIDNETAMNILSNCLMD